MEPVHAFFELAGELVYGLAEMPKLLLFCNQLMAMVDCVAIVEAPNADFPLCMDQVLPFGMLSRRIDPLGRSQCLVWCKNKCVIK